MKDSCFFGKRIKELREEKQLLQRQMAYSLDIDTPLYSKIERGDRRAKKEQVAVMAKLFDVEEKELMTLWLASQINELINGNIFAIEALELVLKKQKEMAK